MMVFDTSIFEHIAKFLAALKQPDFVSFSVDEVNSAMRTVFTIDGPNTYWLSQLKSRIQELSFGLTLLEEAAPEEFAYRIKSPEANYYRLKGLFRTQLVIMGPFHPPVQFVNNAS